MQRIKKYKEVLKSQVQSKNACAIKLMQSFTDLYANQNRNTQRMFEHRLDVWKTENDIED